MLEQFNFFQKLGIGKENATIQIVDNIFKEGDILTSLDENYYYVITATSTKVVCKTLNWWGRFLYTMGWL